MAGRQRALSPGARPPGPPPAANAERITITEWGVDPYAQAQANSLAGFDKLTLEGNAAPDTIRIGADDPGSTLDFAPLQVYPGAVGAPGPVPIGQNVALPAAKGPAPDPMGDLLEEQEL